MSVLVDARPCHSWDAENPIEALQLSRAMEDRYDEFACTI